MLEQEVSARAGVDAQTLVETPGALETIGKPGATGADYVLDADIKDYFCEHRPREAVDADYCTEEIARRYGQLFASFRAGR